MTYKDHNPGFTIYRSAKLQIPPLPLRAAQGQGRDDKENFGETSFPVPRCTRALLFAGVFAILVALTGCGGGLGGSGGGSGSSALSIATATLPDGIVGSAYSATVSASGGTPPYTWYLASGALPSTVALAATTGSISGTPTATGTFNVTLQVSDAANHSAQQTYSLVISVSDYEVQLTWAASPSQNVAGYNIYRSVNGGTSFIKITPSPVAGLAYTDLTVADGQNYDYAVTAVNTGGQESVYSPNVQTNVP
jgi:hypothetical protein